jgi:hypothetical protein
MVGPGPRSGAWREPNVHLETHATIQGRQAERPLPSQRQRDIRGARERARDGPLANPEDEGQGLLRETTGQMIQRVLGRS